MQSVFICADSHKSILCRNRDKAAFRELTPNADVTLTAMLILFSVI